MYQLHRVYVKGVMSCVSTSILRLDGWSSELSNVNKKSSNVSFSWFYRCYLSSQSQAVS